MNDTGDAGIGCIVLVAGILLMAAICSLPMWILWNWLFPEIFGLPEISIFQAFGLSLMVNMFLRPKPSED